MSSSDSKESCLADLNPEKSTSLSNANNLTLKRKYSDEKINLFNGMQIDDDFFEDFEGPPSRISHPQKMRRMLSSNLKHSNLRGTKIKHLNRMLTSRLTKKKTNIEEKAEMATLLRMNTSVMQGLRNSFLPLGTLGVAEQSNQPVDTEMAVLRAQMLQMQVSISQVASEQR